MRWGLLGPLLIQDDDDVEVVVPTGRLRVLLAFLLTRANQPVSLDELAEAAWDGPPSPTAARTVQVYLGRLRRALGPTIAARIVTQAPGYLCKVGEDELDLLRFERLCRRARSAAYGGDWPRTAQLLTEALGLWRGTPLVDIPSELLREREVPRLEQLHLQAIEDHIDAQIHLGRHELVIPQLRDLTTRHPLREHLHGQLMRALAGAGQRAEALEVYQRARHALVDQLGLEPGPELRQLQERVLAGDAELVAPRADASTGSIGTGPDGAGPDGNGADGPTSDGPTSDSAAAVPRQLPAAVRHFVGRAEELKALSEPLGARGEAAGAVVIFAVVGTAGVGKTALAVHWGHQHADQFPDGQLYVNLRGFDSQRPPVPSESVIRDFLAALGVSAQSIPVDPDAQAALYRSRLADKRMLILLDNARSAEQVRPLLPGAPGCVVLVTSRTRLAGLVALEGAVPVTLDLLSEPDAWELLASRLGRERLNGEEATITELIGLCARLPLALNIAAAHATLQPASPLAQFAHELRDAYRRLDALTTGEAAADVRAVFSWSYRTLTPDAARVFRLLGLHPGQDISLLATASLAALDPDDARRCLDELTRANLIAEQLPGRYAFHDLLHAYAADQAMLLDGAAEREEALRRVCDFYTHTAHCADQLLAPHRLPIELAPPAPGTHPHTLPDVPAAMAWFELEYPNLLAAQQAAVAHGMHLTVWQLACTLGTFQFRKVYRQDELTVWRAALEATFHLNDPAARTRAYRLIGRAYAELGRHEEAIDHLHQALALADRGPDLFEQAHSHRQLAWAWERWGDDRKALHHARRALNLYRMLDEPIWEANALNQVGWYAAHLGDYDTAREHCEAALTLHRRHDNPDGEANTQDSLGYIDHHTGDHERAIEHYEQALTLYRGLGNTYQYANTLEGLGHPYAALHQRDRARAVWRKALELYTDQGRSDDAKRVRRYIEALG